VGLAYAWRSFKMRYVVIKKYFLGEKDWKKAILFPMLKKK